jgi:hypothetical protein
MPYNYLFNIQKEGRDTDFIYFEYIPISENAGLYGSSIFIFGRNPILFSVVIT